MGEVEMKTAAAAQVILLHNLVELQDHIPPKQRLVNSSSPRGIVVGFEPSDVLVGGWSSETLWPVSEM